MSFPAHADEAPTWGRVAVAVVQVEAFGMQGEQHQGDVLLDHALRARTARADVSASLIDEVAQILRHLLQDGGLDQAKLKHGGRVKRKN